MQRNRPPAALPAGPSAFAAEPEPADIASDAVAFDSAVPAETVGGPSAEAEAAAVVDDGEIQPSAGVASPTGMIKPPPVAAVSSAAPVVPLPDGPGPSMSVGPLVFGPVGGEDAVGPDDDTAPLPVILPGQISSDVAQLTRMRDPFEPIERQQAPLPRRVIRPDPVEAASSGQATDPGVAKLDQIKDLYLTAEAIGDDALGKHFEQVSDRQRQLIREYFDQMASRGPEGQPES